MHCDTLFQMVFYFYLLYFIYFISMVIKSSIKHTNLCHLRIPFSVLVPVASGLEPAILLQFVEGTLSPLLRMLVQKAHLPIRTRD